MVCSPTSIKRSNSKLLAWDSPPTILGSWIVIASNQRVVVQRDIAGRHERCPNALPSNRARISILKHNSCISPNLEHSIHSLMRQLNSQEGRRICWHCSRHRRSNTREKGFETSVSIKATYGTANGRSTLGTL